MTFLPSECSATTTQFGNTSEITTNVSTYSSIHLSRMRKRKVLGKECMIPYEAYLTKCDLLQKDLRQLLRHVAKFALI